MLAALTGAASPRTRAQIEADIRQEADNDAAAGQRDAATALRVFADEASQVGMPPREIMTIYQDEYRQEIDKRKPGPWEAYRFQIMTVLAIVGFLGAIFRKSIEDVLGKGLGRLWGAIYDRYAGSRLLRRWALTQYRRRLIDRLALLKLPFRPERPLAMRDVYVPLRIAESQDAADRTRQVQEASDALANHRRLVVLGAPGSGKSMLVKHLALIGAERRLPAALGEPIPVVVELHRFADPKATIESEIVAELGRTGFPHAETFVRQNLEKRSFLLLLDGFDEIPAAQRSQIVQQIKDLVSKYDELRFVLTCRVAVYKGELYDVADRTLELIDFNDHQIERYLRTWTSSMPPGKSVDELITMLANRPQIKKLAGNPLLLTIIAYLYADHPDVVLPHSRSQFYKTATDQLLERWHQDQNKFTLPQKRAILEHLALFNQAGADPTDADRRTMDFRVVSEQVKAICPSLNLKPEDSDRVIQEIVERSGLLLAIDGGQRYCFAHLTLQEYFTAARLQHQPEQMIRHYQTDRDAWRETLRLWCGLAPDSTDVIHQVSAVDPVTAFECLADAQMVSPELADAIIAELKGKLGTAGTEGAAIQAAFGTVAADPRVRGSEVLAFLIASLDDPELVPMAANALAQTGLMRAADALGTRVRSYTTAIRQALVTMSDVSVPILTRALDHGARWALEDLCAIGTPRVAEALVPLLWSATPGVAHRVALALGALLHNPHAEAALRGVALAPEHRASTARVDWAWKPFHEPDGSSLPIIAGRIVFLIDAASSELLPRATLDKRIVLPACILQFAREPGCVERIWKEDTSPPKTADRVDAWLDKLGASGKLRAVLAMMEPDLLARLIGKLVAKSRAPTRDDWLSMFRPTSYDFQHGWHLRVYIAICLSLCVPAFLEVAQRLWSLPFELTRALAAALLAVMIVLGVLRAAFRWPTGEGSVSAVAILTFCGPIIMFGQMWDLARSNRHGDWGVSVVGSVIGLLTYIWVLLAWSYGGDLLTRHLPPGVFAAWFLVAGACCALLILRIVKLDYVAENPLFDLWDHVARPSATIRTIVTHRASSRS
ncbi:MAG TPA: NACHT domain-containing protein [Kofleriaceae bacterium]